MQKQVLIAGGGIGGLAAAVGASRAGWGVQLYERAAEFTEVGAGVQIGPNVVRRLQAWGLQKPLQGVAAFPGRLQVRSALSGDVLASMRLGADAITKYGAAYATIHRADLHGVLLEAARACGDVQLNLNQAVEGYAEGLGVVGVRTSAGLSLEAEALIGADGLRSRIRAQMLGETVPRVSGHLAYRAVVAQSGLPERLRSTEVTAWLGPRLHVVQYPVRRGELMNVVAILEGPAPLDVEHWDHADNAVELESALAGSCTALQDLVRAVPHVCAGWRLWPLSDRPPMRSAGDMAQGQIALLGDAAHPMRPYLAQGAGMAIEDAAELQRALAMDDLSTAERLRHYAQNRWQRAARVQERSRRNGRIFHATGPVRWGRDLALRALGERLLDVPWLYRGEGSAASAL